jgi:hypothetical protein
VVALVFDRLSPEARALARKAGLAYAEEGITGGGFTGVFGIDQALRTIQSYTDNPELLRQAVEKATSTSTSPTRPAQGKSATLSDRSTALSQQSSIKSPLQVQQAPLVMGPARPLPVQRSDRPQLNRRYRNGNTHPRKLRALERDQQGFATINSLLAVITPMRNLPGRKTIIFFSEGLALPQSVQTKFPVGN